jgi:hypothetical protein
MPWEHRNGRGRYYTHTRQTLAPIRVLHSASGARFPYLTDQR